LFLFCFANHNMETNAMQPSGNRGVNSCGGVKS
jgi:hypothetical protein